jgi:hypothetical protein
VAVGRDVGAGETVGVTVALAGAVGTHAERSRRRGMINRVFIGIPGNFVVSGPYILPYRFIRR